MEGASLKRLKTMAYSQRYHLTLISIISIHYHNYLFFLLCCYLSRWLGVASVGVSYPPTNSQNKTERERPSKNRRRPKPVDMSSPTFCRKVPGLVRSQRRLCQRSRDVFAVISEGAKLAIDECHRQFESERWNCSTKINLENPFGRIINLGENILFHFTLVYI